MLLRQEPAIFVCLHYNGIPIVSYMILNSRSVVRINKTFDEADSVAQGLLYMELEGTIFHNPFWFVQVNSFLNFWLKY